MDVLKFLSFSRSNTKIVQKKDYLVSSLTFQIQLGEEEFLDKRKDKLFLCDAAPMK